jgi:secondary thiamine-phosphate synthase enzyme
MVKQKTLTITTPGAPEFIDLTDDVGLFVRSTGIKNGIISVVSEHTTAAIRVNENESGFIQDFKDLIIKLIPPGQYYRHNDSAIRTENIDCADDRCTLNGHSHCQHMLLGTSETLPVTDGELKLGRWQRIFLVELCSSRERQVVLTVIGE